MRPRALWRPAARALVLLSMLCAVVLLLRSPSGAWAQGFGAYGGAPDPRLALDRTRAEEGSILDQLAMFDQELGRTLTAMVELETRAKALDEERAGHVIEAKQAEERLDGLRVVVKERLRGLYRLHRQGVARVIFGAQDPLELRRRGRYMLALVRADADQLNAFAQSAERVRTAVAAVERDIEQLGHLKVELRAQEETLRAQRQARLDLLRQVRSERDLAMRAVAEVGVARGDLDQRLGTFDPAAMGAGGDAWHDAGVGSTGTFRDAYGRLPWPVHGRVIHRFGPYTDPSSGRPMTSQGLDIAADHGEPVRAVFSGRVQMAEYIRGFGQTVVLEHGPYVSLYAHLGSLRVSAGAPIRAGDVLGLVGNTGLTDEEGYMLSFQVRYNNSPQDPMLWLERR